MSKCVLIEKPEYGGCCCRCKYRLRLLEKQRTSGYSLQVGWACIVAFFDEGEDIAYKGDFEHGMCELFQRRQCSEIHGLD